MNNINECKKNAMKEYAKTRKILRFGSSRYLIIKRKGKLPNKISSELRTA